ncbi:MARCKS-related protein 1-A [Sinocyclocheilus grahami]|uniref:MARCKS-related protein-like n=1 Tax=Sinocyclocheilus grahami TaxID=75366 RepID=A0A672LTR1_SINGR|nr:PREDICTED: MARCKS-related protein-like [Sinocyclocheilus grahami]
MGAQLSKGEATVDGKAVAEKANGQENGHVKTNGDVSTKPDGEAVAADGNGTVEVAKEEAAKTEAVDGIEAAPATEGDAAKSDGEAAKETKKKKKFSLKNSFKFKGISLKKNKKESQEAVEPAATPTAEDKPEENGQAATETKEEEPAAAETNVTPAPEAEAEPKAEEEEEEPKAEEPAQETEAAPTEETTKSDETPAPAEETTPTTASDPEPAAE